MVVGAGALGNEVLKNLAVLGVGFIFIVDIDCIEMSNLSRSVLYRAEDAGRLKAEVAAERIQAINPDVRTQFFNGDCVRELGLGVFRRMDLVIACVDNREARWAINRACWRVTKPWLDGALDSLNGHVKYFSSPEGACYECGMSELDFRVMSLRHGCQGRQAAAILQGRTPTVITSATIIAGVQVQEMLKLLHEMPLSPGTGFLYDGTGSNMQSVKLARRKDCPAHEKYEPIIELNKSARELTLQDLLAIGEERLGPGAYLHLDRQVVTKLTCSDCENVESVLFPYAPGMSDISRCPICGNTQFPEVTHLIRKGMPQLDATCLADIGIPLLHIIAARRDKQKIFFELTADADQALGHWRNDNE
jgi:adenylyltransferase/sulfurtransferase